MNILMVTPFFYEPPQAKIGLFRLCKKLQKQGHNIYVLSSSIHQSETYEDIDGVQIIRQRVIYFQQLPYVIPVNYSIIDQLIEKYNIDIIHAHTLQFLTSYFAMKKARKWKKPFIVTVHGMSLSTGRKVLDLLAMIYDKIFSKKIVNNAHVIIVLSKELSKRAIKLGAITRKIHVVPNGFDFNYQLAANPNNLRSRFNIKREDFIVGFIGRLYPIKGVDYLIEAGISLVKSYPNIRFFIVGDGPLRHNLMNNTKNYRDNFMFLGYVQEAYKIYSLLDLMVLPSLSEGFSTTLCESMGSGVPIIATDVGAAKDIIKNYVNGILVPPKDVYALKKTITQLYQNQELRKKLGDNGQKIIKKYYSWNVIVEKIEKLYTSVIEDIN